MTEGTERLNELEDPYEGLAYDVPQDDGNNDGKDNDSTAVVDASEEAAVNQEITDAEVSD